MGEAEVVGGERVTPLIATSPQEEKPMSFPSVRFQNGDFIDPIPDEGFHEAIIHSVRCRTSENRNPLVQVTYQLPDVAPDRDRLVDHFIIAGNNVRAIAVGRRRLLALCRACGVEPKEGEDLSLQELLGARLEVRIGHDTYQGSARARVLAYRPLP